MPNLYGSTDPDKTHSLGSNYSAFSNKSVDQRMDAIQRMPLADQAAAWNALDKEVATKYFPLFTTYYGGVAQAHGSKIMGDNDNNVAGMPTFSDMWVSQ
jgi:peptide/nickel transport system substrate-binding protein